MLKKQFKVLVTGGAGFIGSNLCNNLIENGHKVVCIDNLSTGSRDNIKHLEGHENFQFVKYDVEEPFFSSFVVIDNMAMPILYYLEGIDMIYHLAAPASPSKYQADAIKTTKTIVIGMLNVLELASKKNIPLLFTSTSEVYGDPDPEHFYQTEKYWGNVNPMGLRSCYDEGKRCAESLCFDAFRQYNVDVRVVRLFNTYGPRMRPDDGRVISNFIMQALKNEPITIYGKGTQTRSYCYVDDTVDGLKRAMLYPAYTKPDDKKHLLPINIGNNKEYYTVSQIAKKVIELTNSKSSIVFKDLPEDDPKIRRPDTSLALSWLSWKPTTGIDFGLRRSIKYFKQFV